MLDQHFRRDIGFLLISAVCMALGGCAEALPPEHKAVVSRMQGLGGKVLFAEGGYRLNMQNSRISDDDLKELHKVQDLKGLDLQGAQITDEGLQEIAKLKSLVSVTLTGTPTTIEGRDALRKARPDMEVKH
jgi:hypothetical protein